MTCLYLSVKKLSELGERQAIRLIEQIVSKADVAVGIGDDCAAFQIGEEYILVTTDMITQKTHIPDVMTPYQIGWFAVAINLSDLAAKGGRPLGVVIALGLPLNTSERFLTELIKGANSCAQQYNTGIVGGDTKENPELTVCATAIGCVNKNQFMPRKGAKVGDCVVVTGSLGKAGAGFYALKQGKKDEKNILGLVKPKPRLLEGMLLAKQQKVHCCMDISDGLSSSLYQLQIVNPVGFAVNKQDIPLDASLAGLYTTNTALAYDLGLHFGGDYELLFTVSKNDVSRIKKVFSESDTPLTVIGRVTDEQKIVLTEKKVVIPLENKGFEHFFRNEI